MRHPSAEIAGAVCAALRSLAICTPAVLLGEPAALAQAVQAAALTADIPAQPLAQALAAFARQTGLQLVYVSGLATERRSHAVPAGLAADAALGQLLQGTGLKFEYLTASSVRIFPAEHPAAEGRSRTPAPEESYEVIVTANRREQNVQDVPITIQTISGEQLQDLRVTTFNDLLRYTTNVTTSANGPGTGNIFIRGLGAVGTGGQSQATVAPFPNVALYLDDQAMQFPARNNDVYVIDMERVEVLEGPQGTLLGGGAEAGAIRYITSKPKLDAVRGEVRVGYGTTAGGDPNTVLSAVLNVPLLVDELALRAVIFSERRGGYIDNVPGTIGFVPGSVPAIQGGNPLANNAGQQGEDLNAVNIQGFRLSALWKISDAWELLLQQNYQDMKADGYFYAYPLDSNGKALSPDQITAFAPAYNKDRYQSTAWTLSGQIGEVRAVYTGSYMERSIDGQQDYSNYLRSRTGTYYACIGTGAYYFNAAKFAALVGHPLQCYAPVAAWRDIVNHTHHGEELRFSTSESYRLRGLIGGYWEKFVINDNMNFNYLKIPQCDPVNLQQAIGGGPDCLSAVGPPPGSWASQPGLRTGMANAFGEDDQRGYKQTAVFASVDFDIVPKVLTLTGGIRHYAYQEFEHGSEWFTQSSSPLLINHPNGACTYAGACGWPINLDKSESGQRYRGDLTWHITPDVMTYYTYAEGFRPGGFNRVKSQANGSITHSRDAPYCPPFPIPPGTPQPVDPRCLPGGSLFGLPTFQYQRPAAYDSDTLISHELGVRSQLLDHRLLLNASAYYMHWNDVQFALFDPAHLANNTFNLNGPSYTIKGLELQVMARVTEGLTLQGSSSWNSAKQTNTPCLLSAGATPGTPNNPTPAGQCITVIKGYPYTNPYGALNTPPPYSPPLMFNVRARYDFAAGAWKPFAWAGASHIASMSNTPASYPDGNDPAQNPPTTSLLKYTIPGYTIYEAALGVGRDNWNVQLSGSNLSNSGAATNITSSQFIRAEIPLRPRVLLVDFAYRF